MSKNPCPCILIPWPKRFPPFVKLVHSFAYLNKEKEAEKIQPRDSSSFLCQQNARNSEYRKNETFWRNVHVAS
jgi:hypothetical protein